jgi:hypothetical protein
MLLSVVCLVVALICALVPTAVLGANWDAWISGGLIFWAVDVLLGGYTQLAVPVGRRTPPSQ